MKFNITFKFNFKLKFKFKFKFKLMFIFNFKLIFKLKVVISNETNGPQQRCTSEEAIIIEARHKIYRTNNRGKKDLLNGIMDQFLLKNLLLSEQQDYWKLKVFLKKGNYY